MNPKKELGTAMEPMDIEGFTPDDPVEPLHGCKYCLHYARRRCPRASHRK